MERRLAAFTASLQCLSSERLVLTIDNIVTDLYRIGLDDAFCGRKLVACIQEWECREIVAMGREPAAFQDELVLFNRYLQASKDYVIVDLMYALMYEIWHRTYRLTTVYFFKACQEEMEYRRATAQRRYSAE